MVGGGSELGGRWGSSSWRRPLRRQEVGREVVLRKSLVTCANYRVTPHDHDRLFPAALV